MLQPATVSHSSHSLSYPNSIRLQEVLGYDQLSSLKQSLAKIGVTIADREQAFYPAILGWLETGLEDGMQITAADVVTAAEELAIKKDRRGHPLNAIYSFIRIRALRRAEREESAKQADLTTRRRQQEGDQQRSLTRIAVAAQRQPFPPEYERWKADATRLADELRSLGRSPRELPEDPREWPKTYLPAAPAAPAAED